jgi:acetyltransferase
VPLPQPPAIIRRLGADDVAGILDGLVELLSDAVDSGASVGFLPPMDPALAATYWSDVRAALGRGHRLLLGAFSAGSLVGSVQLDLATMPNGLHRAEVMKLFVHRSARGQGIATHLMQAVEQEARRSGRTLLVLDTRPGDPAERLYLSLGYARVGQIPRYAKGADGVLYPTVFLYKELGAAE